MKKAAHKFILKSWGARLLSACHKALSRTARKLSNPPIPGLNESGVSLVGIIITLLVLGILGAVMYSLTTTSTLSTVASQNAMRAYYLAESGPRVVASEYTGAATVSDKNTVLENFHNNTVSLPGNQGSFSVQLFPYWFYATANYSDADSTIVLTMPGGIPLVNQDDTSTQITFPSSGLLKIKGRTKVVEYNSGPTISGSDITFTNVTIPAGYTIAAGAELFFAFTSDPATGNQAVAEGGSLVLPGAAYILPSRDGSLKIGKHDYIYEKRVPEQIDPDNLPSTITLMNITSHDPDEPGEFPLDITYDAANSTDLLQTSQIYVAKNIAVHSTGTVGQGSMAATRKEVYVSDVEKGLFGNKPISFEDDIPDFDPVDNWDPSDPNQPVEIDLDKKELYLGGGLLDGHGAAWYGGDDDSSNCIDGECDFDKGFAAYFAFQFVQADGTPFTDSTSGSTGSADGFTFAVINGVSNDNDVFGGPTSGSMGEMIGYAGYSGGLGNGGLKPPKIGVEFDTYPNTGSGNICYADSRKDYGSPFGNHMALIYWGEEIAYCGDGTTRADLNDDNRHGEGGSVSSTTTTTLPSSTTTTTLPSGGGGGGEVTYNILANSGTTVVAGSGGWGGSGEVVTNTYCSEYDERDFQRRTLMSASAMSCRELRIEKSGGTFLEAYFNTAVTGPTDITGNDLKIYLRERDGRSATMVFELFYIDGSGNTTNFYTTGSGHIVNLGSYDEGFYTLDLSGQSATLPFGAKLGLRIRKVTTSYEVRMAVGYDVDNQQSGILRVNYGASGTTTTTTISITTTTSTTTTTTLPSTVGPPMNSVNSDTGSGNDGYYQVNYNWNGQGFNWLEDGQLYHFRIEYLRPEIPNATSSWSAAKMEAFKDVRGTVYDDPVGDATLHIGDPKIAKTIKAGNSLQLDTGDHADLERILFGFTQGTGGKTQHITVKDFELFFLKRYPNHFVNEYPDNW
jgi:hypothetical protein